MRLALLAVEVHDELMQPTVYVPCVQMPTGTGKTITLLSLITSYQLAHPEVCF